MVASISSYERYIAGYGGEDSDEKPAGLVMGNIYKI